MAAHTLQEMALPAQAYRSQENQRRGVFSIVLTKPPTNVALGSTARSTANDGASTKTPSIWDPTATRPNVTTTPSGPLDAPPERRIDAPRRYPEKSFLILDSASVKLCSSSVLPHEISAQNCAGFEAKQKSKSSWTHSNPGTWKRCRFLKWKTDGLPLAHGSGKV